MTVSAILDLSFSIASSTIRTVAQSMAITIIFVLGGAGAGKGTQCSKLAQKYHIQHLSVGDILREEASNPSSEFANTISENMRNGTVGPMEITVELLRRAIEVSVEYNDTSLFLLDGFPRKMDQLQLFETTIQPADFAIFLECNEQERFQRLLQRARDDTSTRQDDDEETIRKRFATFTETTLPVIEYLEADRRLLRVDGQHSADVTFESMGMLLRDALSSRGMVLRLRI